MFSVTVFNNDISNWDVSNVNKMTGMFKSSKFNNDISNWDVSNVEYMDKMFYRSEFNQNINRWQLNNIKDMSEMFVDSPLENKNEYKPKCLQLNEAFNFDSVNKQKKSINVNDIL
jgi:surface protein